MVVKAIWELCLFQVAPFVSFQGLQIGIFVFGQKETGAERVAMATPLRVTLTVVTLQTFTRGKLFHLGKISLGKFTSGFIFPKLKGHTGDHWTLGGLTSQRIKFQLACSKFWRKKLWHKNGSFLPFLVANNMTSSQI